jgi:hypothetical protein
MPFKLQVKVNSVGIIKNASFGVEEDAIGKIRQTGV